VVKTHPIKVKLKDEDGKCIEVTLMQYVDHGNGALGTGFVGFRSDTSAFVFVTLQRLFDDAKFQRWVS